jgi:uncharacterized membrane protein
LDFFGLMRKYVFLYVYFWREKKMCDAWASCLSACSRLRFAIQCNQGHSLRHST